MGNTSAKATPPTVGQKPNSGQGNVITNFGLSGEHSDKSPKKQVMWITAPVPPESKPNRGAPAGQLWSGYSGRVYDTDKMYTMLKGYFIGRGMDMALTALGYMRRQHEGHYRESGQPYEIHPLMMATYAVSLSDHKNITETTYALILLHDVPEEMRIPIEEMPFPYEVQRGLRYMTKVGFEGETKYELRRRYINELLEDKNATITKGIDRYKNLKTMVGALTNERICRNVVETDMLLLPALRQAKKKWPEASNLLDVLCTDIQACNDIIAQDRQIMLTDKHFVNRDDAIDFSYLITGEKPPQAVIEWQRKQQKMNDFHENEIMLT